jgi:heterodisulfide reductase subunit C
MRVNDRPLRSLILAKTGQDVRQCQACDLCEDLRADGMDLSFGEILRCAARDDLRALTCASLWRCEPLLDGPAICQAGPDIAAVIRFLRREALRRGLGPQAPVPEWIL